MRIELKTEGGLAYFPALAKPRALDSDDLPEGERKKLAALIAAADFFDLPSDMTKSAPGAADYQTYTLTIEQDGKQHTVRCNDPVTNQPLADLLDFIRAKLASG